jgi:cytochrome c biogenesis protein CcmG/thiol:disulfide interchange protein DsbE
MQSPYIGFAKCRGKCMRYLAIFLLVLGLSARAAEPAPVLVVPTLSGPTFDLAALKGHPVIVNFWATWCVPCRAEMPMLSDFYTRHHGEGVEMIGLSVDSPRDLPKVKTIAAGVHYPIAVARDAKENGFPAANALPVTYVIDAKGMVKAKLTPEGKDLTDDQLAALIKP